MDEKGATTFGDLKLAPRERSWDRAAADKRVRAWAGADEKPNAKYRRAFFWFDSEAADTFGAFKLQFADIIEGSLVAVPRGVFACAGAIQGARGGVDIPAGDVPSVKAHIGKYYAKMRREWDDDTIQPPWKSKAAAAGGEERTGMEFKSYPAEFKVVDTEGRIVEAYASIFGNVDEGGDRANRGMFARSIEEDFDQIAFCWQHDWKWPIGVPQVVEEHSTGLFTRSYVSETSSGNDALVLLRDGAVKQMSIGYNTVRSMTDEETGVRDLLEVDLWEYSPVTWAMNRLARVTGVKNGDFALALKRFAAIQDEITADRMLDPTYLDRMIDTLKALREATPGGRPPSLDGDGEALDPAVKAAAADLSAFVQRVKLGEELEEFAQSVR
jgi:HK97 family phage prohead protease